MLQDKTSSRGHLMTIPFVIFYEVRRNWGSIHELNRLWDSHPWAQQVMSYNCCVGVQSKSDTSSRRPLLLVMDIWLSRKLYSELGMELGLFDLNYKDILELSIKVMPCWAWVAPLIWCFIPSWLLSAKSWNFIK